MQSLLEDKNCILIGASFFSDLEDLNLGVRPIEIRLWSDDKRIKGICVVYANDKEIAHGQREASPQHVIKLNPDEVMTELEIHVAQGAEDKLSITAIAIATSKFNILRTGT